MPIESDWTELARFHVERLRRWRCLRRQPPQADHALRSAATAVARHTPDAPQRLTELVVDYLWQGHLRALGPHRTLAYYPGAPSIYGARNDAIEGVTRVLPLWAAAINADAGRSMRCQQMQEQVRVAILNGCDPAHQGYWGDIHDHSTLICEAADVSLALWLSRRWLWDTVDAATQQRIRNWLGQCVGKCTADNNWHLFVVLTDATLSALCPNHAFSSQDRLSRIMSFAREDGCFVDGPKGGVDLYNAWAFHYVLYWLGEIQPALLPSAAERMLCDFCRWYRYLFTPNGVPLWGRSLCYRFALPVPLLAGALKHCESADVATATAVYFTTLAFFIHRGGLRQGRPTQGVFGEDIRWLDAYSGPASSLWGSRSIVLFLHGRNTFRQSNREPRRLPAEEVKIDQLLTALNARLITDPVACETSIEFVGNTAKKHLRTRIEQTTRDKAKQIVFAQGHRQNEISEGNLLLQVRSGMSEFGR